MADEKSLDEIALRKKYEERFDTFVDLEEEVCHVIERELEKVDFKIHSIDSRIKTIESIITKAKSKGILDSISQLFDIVGIRIVCLLISDLEQISDLVHRKFRVISYDDKVNASEDVFGYMSLHLICQMPDEYTGPRYDEIKDISFEIQIRTISMHAWATMSHYLEYKGDWDVPAELRKSLNALSAIFYLADRQFASFYTDSINYRKSIKKDKDLLQEEINLDTLQRYLLLKFSERSHSDNDAVSALLREIKICGINNLRELDDIINSSAKNVDAYEKVFFSWVKKNTPDVTISSSEKMADIGMVRMSLAFELPEYFKATGREQIKESVELMELARKMASED